MKPASRNCRRRRAAACERVRAVLDAALAHRLRGNLRDRVEGAWLALGGPACYGDATDLEDAEIFLDELEREEDAGDLTNTVRSRNVSPNSMRCRT